MILAQCIELAKDTLLRPAKAASPEIHIREAVQWICRAQDAGCDRGVSHSYVIGKGWLRSYPETTGYIIPTMLNWSVSTGDAATRRRALDMADWELTVQLDTGAIPTISDERPAVFDTGQVIFGWIAAFEASGSPDYLAAAVRAGDWLVETWDKTAWTNAQSPGDGRTVYNARVAWALLELAKRTGTERYTDCAREFLDWALARERGDGWFDHNCLNDSDHPLLHTIAYSANGLLESGLLLEDEQLICAAARTATALVARIGADGRMSGRFGPDWLPAVKWSCLTGMAQMAIVWQRLHEIDRGVEFLAASQRVNSFLMQTHDVSSRNGGLRGGIRGSFPVNGTYGRYKVLNWATKFFIDAIQNQVRGQAAAFRY